MLSNITLEMVKRSGKSPEFRAKGAETRHLIPFAVELSKLIFDTEDSILHKMVSDMFANLYKFYACMGVEPFNPEKAADAAKRFLVLYSDISDMTADNLWRIKPKFHMLQELAEFQAQTSGDPSRFWAYQDESFVGIIAKMAHSRGGKRSAVTTPEGLIDKYRMQE